MDNIKILDLEFQGAKQTIASFLVMGNDGPVLVETGPESTWLQLQSKLATHGLKPKDIQHVLLSHIHFDHAGAAWKFAELGAKIYVHPAGSPHLAEPSKLWQSAEMIYGDAMEQLWGKMAPIPAAQLVAVNDGDVLKFGNLEFRALHTPGHAIHHIAWSLGHTLFTGDVAGVKIGEGPVMPPCPPPDIHIEHWKNSLSLIKKNKPKSLFLTHFGKIDDPGEHLLKLEVIIDDWAFWMKKHYDLKTPTEEIIPQFMTYTALQMTEAGADRDLIKLYEYANPSWMSVNGLLRYWKLKEQGRI